MNLCKRCNIVIEHASAMMISSHHQHFVDQSYGKVNPESKSSVNVDMTKVTKLVFPFYEVPRCKINTKLWLDYSISTKQVIGRLERPTIAKINLC